MKNEKTLKNLAARYVNEAGEEFHRERVEIEREAELPPLDRLDAKMRVTLFKEREHRRKRRLVIGTIAASFALIAVVAATVLPQANRRFAEDGALNDLTAVAESAPDAAPAAPGAGPTEPQAAAPPGIVEYFLEETDEIFWGLAEDLGTGAAWGDDSVFIITPEGRRLYEVEQRDGITIFRLESGATVTASTGPPGETDLSDFSETNIAGTQVFLRAGDELSTLIFEQNGLQVTLTTAYDYRELIEVAKYWLG